VGLFRISEDPQIGEMPTIDNINTESVIDNGENSELQSTANGGIIENRGDNYVNDADGRGNIQGDGRGQEETDQTAYTGTEGKVGSSFRGTQENYIRRKKAEAQAKGTEDRLKISASSNGNIVYAYVSKASDDSEAYRAVEILKSRGYDAYYSDGRIEEVTESKVKAHNQAVTTSDGKVIVSSNATGPAEQIADHEEVHLCDKSNSAAYETFQDAVFENLEIGGTAYLEVAKK